MLNRWYLGALTLALMTVSSTSLAHTGSDAEFSMKKYIEKCGGEIYPACDDPQGIDQMDIYKEAKHLAVEQGKNLLMIFGADWCGPCHTFNKLLHSDEETLKNIEKSYIIVEINGDVESARAVEQELNINVRGFPTAFVVESKTQKMVKRFFPTGFETLKEFAEFVFRGKLLSSEDITMLGSSSVALSNQPIELEPGIGTAKYFAKAATSFEKYVNQGFNFLHAFNYIDALRSFKMAEKENPESPISYAGQIISYMKLSPEMAYIFVHEILARAPESNSGLLAFFSSPSRDDLWLEFAKSYFYENSSTFVASESSEFVPLAKSYGKLKDSFGDDPEVLSLATHLYLAQKDDYEKALEINPNHSGAQHYLLHYYEGQSDFGKAVELAEKFASNAPNSAHAQHMYGHTLPLVGKWDMALEQFEKAARIHEKWAKRNGVDQSEDWHYSHNLHLMSAVQFAMGSIQEAASTMQKACELDARACLDLINVHIAAGHYREAKKVVDDLEEKFGSAYADYWNLERAKADLAINGESALADLMENEAAESESLTQIMMALYSEKDFSVLKEKIQLLVENRVKVGGFDGWAGGFPQLVALLKAAETADHKEAQALLREIIKELAPQFAMN